MANTGKALSERDANQTLQHAYNSVDASLTVNGFLVGKVGHKVTLTLSTTTLTDDTETYAFLDGATALYSLKLIYTTGSREVLLSAERIS